MPEIEQNYNQEKEGLASLYPDLVTGIEKKKENKAKKEAKLTNDSINKKSKNTGKVIESVIVETTSKNKQQQAKIHPFLLGKPEGSGMKKGQITQKIILKEEARERYINKMNQIQDRLIVAQTTLAIGSMQILAKVPYEENGVEKTRLQIIEDTQLIIDILTNTDLEAGEDFFVIKKTEPNQQAIAYVLDQTIGKPVAKTEVTGKDGGAIESNSNVTVEFINAKKLNNET